MDIETVQITINIEKEVYEDALLLSKRQNSQLNNSINAYIRDGVKNTYIKYPNLKGEK